MRNIRFLWFTKRIFTGGGQLNNMDFENKQDAIVLWNHRPGKHTFWEGGKGRFFRAFRSFSPFFSRIAALHQKKNVAAAADDGAEPQCNTPVSGAPVALPSLKWILFVASLNRARAKDEIGRATAGGWEPRGTNSQLSFRRTSTMRQRLNSRSTGTPSNASSRSLSHTFKWGTPSHASVRAWRYNPTRGALFERSQRPKPKRRIASQVSEFF